MRLSIEELIAHLTKLYTLCPPAAAADLRMLESHLLALREDPSHKVMTQLTAQTVALADMRNAVDTRLASVDARLTNMEAQLTSLRRALRTADAHSTVDATQRSGYVEAYMAQRLGITRMQARAMIGMAIGILSALSYLVHEVLQLRAPAP